MYLPLAHLSVKLSLSELAMSTSFKPASPSASPSAAPSTVIDATPSVTPFVTPFSGHLAAARLA